MKEVRSQEVEKSLPCSNYEITDKTLLMGLENYLKYAGGRFRVDEKALSVFVSLDKENTVYKISYEFDYYGMLSKYYSKPLNHPHLISEYKGYYVFFWIDNFSNFLIKEDVVEKIVKERYPEEYEKLEKGQFLLGNNYDHVPVLKLTVKNNMLIDKEFYEE